jgi:hypothetical protein
MPYSPHITIYGALPRFCACDDCGKVLRLVDHDGQIEAGWDFEVEGVPGYGQENVGQFLGVVDEGCGPALAWAAIEGLLPEPCNCGQVLMLVDDGCGNPTPAWSEPTGGVPDPGGCGQVLTLVDDGCGNPTPAWCDAPGGLPEPGGCGQVLTLCDDGCGNPVPAWCDPPGGAGLPDMEGHEGDFLRAGPCTAGGEMHWEGVPNPLPGIDESSDGRVLTARYNCGESFVEWCDAPGGLPDPGGCDQVLMLVDDGCGNPVPAWSDLPGGLPGIECGERYLKTIDDGCGNYSLEWAELPCGPGGLPGIECGERYLKTIDDGCGNYSLEWAELPCGCFDPGCSYDWCGCQNFLATVTIAADLVLADACCASNFVVFAWGGCSGDRLEVSGPIAFDDVQEMNVTGCLFFSCDGVFIAPNVGCSLPSCGEGGQVVFQNGALKYYNGSTWKTLQTTS